MSNIRLYKESEYEMIAAWWKIHQLNAPAKDMFTTDSTYILENSKGEPWVCITMYFTNCKGICFMEGTISNPFISKKGIVKAMIELNNYVSSIAKEKGYSRIVGMTNYPNWKKFIKVTKELGFKENLKDVSTFIKFL
jgi:hypothetical protein